MPWWELVYIKTRIQVCAGLRKIFPCLAEEHKLTELSIPVSRVWRGCRWRTWCACPGGNTAAQTPTNKKFMHTAGRPRCLVHFYPATPIIKMDKTGNTIEKLRFLYSSAKYYKLPTSASRLRDPKSRQMFILHITLVANLNFLLPQLYNKKNLFCFHPIIGPQLWILKCGPRLYTKYHRSKKNTK